ncbi:MAG: hypothetical protein M1817_005436 [Caeruleum heppii]|nr:MAG: hypothetical protein M1817_005436 [Caeruleum heppii]
MKLLYFLSVPVFLSTAELVERSWRSSDIHETGPLQPIFLDAKLDASRRMNELVDNLTSILWTDDSQLHTELLKRHLIRRTPPTPSTTVGGPMLEGVTGVEWDQSCTDEQKDVILDAWHNAREMLNAAIEIAKPICDEYCDEGDGDGDDDDDDDEEEEGEEGEGEEGEGEEGEEEGKEEEGQKNKRDEGFNARWPALQKTLASKSSPQDKVMRHIVDSLNDIKDNVDNVDGPKRQDTEEAERTLRLTCRSMLLGADQKDTCADETRAFVMTPRTGYSSGTTNGQGSQGDYRSVDSWLLNFCDPFFDNGQFPSNTELENKLSEGDQSLCSVGKLHSTAQVMLHKWTQLPWTLNLEAKKGSDGTAVGSDFSKIKDVAETGWNEAKSNADSWSWLIVWSR